MSGAAMPGVPVRAHAGRRPGNDQAAPANAAARSHCLRLSCMSITAPKVVSDGRVRCGMCGNEAAKSICPMLRVRKRSALDEKVPRERRRSKQKDAVTDVQ